MFGLYEDMVVNKVWAQLSREIFERRQCVRETEKEKEREGGGGRGGVNSTTRYVISRRWA